MVQSYIANIPSRGKGDTEYCPLLSTNWVLEADAEAVDVNQSKNKRIVCDVWKV